MTRIEFKKILDNNNIKFKKLIGIEKSFDIEVEKKQIIDRSIFPKHKANFYSLDCLNYDIYSFEF